MMRLGKKLAIHIGADAPRRVDAMLQRQNLTGLTASARELPGGAIGCLGNVALPAQGNACLFTGLPINGPDVAGLIDADAAARLFPQYDGAFVGVFWEEARQILVIATDCLGMQPLYMRQVNGELTLVSETKALSGAPDLAAWGAFISIGHPIGDRSLMSGVHRVPPASVLTYDCKTRRLEVRRYWEWPEPSDNWRDFDFLGALERDIRAYAALGDPGTLLLSGGFDSRLLLFLLKRAGIPVDALVVAHGDEHGNADGRLAQAVARIAGVPCRIVQPPTNFFSSQAYLDYVRASDAGYPSLDLFISKVASQISAPAVWDGLVPGFTFMPLHQPEGGFDAYLRQEIRGFDGASWQAAKALFRRDVVRAMFDGFSDDLRAQVARVPQDTFGLARFVVENRSRNRPAMNPLKVYASRSKSFTPGLSKEFMTCAAMLPFRDKQHGRLYRKLFAQLDKRALSVPVISGGEWVHGTGTSAARLNEHFRAVYDGCMTRYPRLFAGARRRPVEQSRFLDAHLLDGSDEWLDRVALENLRSVSAGNYLAWKLLFHWKAWQWIHGRAGARLPESRPC